MAWNKNGGGKIKQFVVGDKDYILDESPSGFTALRLAGWYEEGNEYDESSAKWEVRKYRTNADGTEMAMKGCTLSDVAANELVVSLTKENFGDTKEILSNLKSREDFLPSLAQVLTAEEMEELNIDPEEYSKISSNDYYDPREMVL